jgi:hypothetical protein
MFCPKCGASQNEALKFCNLCGANLYAVRQVVDTRETNEKFDWSKTWVADMFLSEAERKRREAELDLQRGLTPDVRRLNEIKAGVITSSVGVAVTIFLYVLMKGIILGGDVSSGDAEILSRIWVAGIIPFMVGVGLMINGVFVSKRLVQLTREAAPVVPDAIDKEFERRSLRAADTNEFPSPQFGVTEGTTKHLSISGQKGTREEQT